MKVLRCVAVTASLLLAAVAQGSDIRLRLVNNSQDVSDSSIVIFQKNVAETPDETAVAWRVIENLGHQDHHPFVYPLDFSIAAGDAWGNFTPQHLATLGQRWEMKREASGDVLVLSSTPASRPDEVELVNSLDRGEISACIYRDGKLLALKTSISPGQKAVFKFLPRLYIGVVSQIEEGQVMGSAVISQVNTEISLLGVGSADIVMTGGGPDPIQFNLANVDMQ